MNNTQQAGAIEAIKKAMATIVRYNAHSGQTSCGNHVFNDLREYLASSEPGALTLNEQQAGEMNKETLVRIFKKVSLIRFADDTDYEYYTEKSIHFVQAYFMGTVIDCMYYDGNIFWMMNNDKSYEPLNPQSLALEAWHNTPAPDAVEANSAGVWVKASERMPKKTGTYSGKRLGEPLALYARIDANASMYFATPNGMQFKGWKDFLWLDESLAGHAEGQKTAASNDQDKVVRVYPDLEDKFQVF